MLGPDLLTLKGMQWKYRSGSSEIMIFTQTGPTSGKLGLRYGFGSDPGHPEVYDVAVATTRPHFGGLRWWLICPQCGRRCGKLYLPSGARRFACRLCHNLTYTSSQEHDKRLDVFKRASPEALEAIIRAALAGSGSLRSALWAMQAQVWQYDRMKRRMGERAWLALIAGDFKGKSRGP